MASPVILRHITLAVAQEWVDLARQPDLALAAAVRAELLDLVLAGLLVLVDEALASARTPVDLLEVAMAMVLAEDRQGVADRKGGPKVVPATEIAVALKVVLVVTEIVVPNVAVQTTVGAATIVVRIADLRAIATEVARKTKRSKFG